MEIPETVWTPRDTLNIQRVGNVDVSPDGSHVLFTVTQAVLAPETSAYLTQIFLANRDGSESVQLTHGEASSYAPQWSPDGKCIAFLSSRSGRNNVWLIREGEGEAHQITEIPTSVSSFKWSPDGKLIAFTAIDPQTPEELQAEKEKNDARVIGENVKMQRLYVVSLAQALVGNYQARQLTVGNFNTGGPDVPEAYDWSPDNQSIIFSHSQTPGQADWPSTRVSLVNINNAQIKPLVCGDAVAFDPHISPDGRWVACKVYDDPPWEWSSVVHLVPLNGGPVRALAETHDRRPDLIGWSEDGLFIYFTEYHGTRVRLCALPVDGSPLVVLFEPDGIIEKVRLNRTRTAVGFTLEDPSNPPEVYVSRLDTWDPVQVSRVNEPIRQLPMGHTEVIRWKSVDGLEIEGLLTYPIGYESGKRYPLLVSVHGGPASSWTRFFIGTQSFYSPIAAFAARGYAVLRGNVRGSTGYGKAFRRANYRDWGGKDVQDLLAGVDHVIAMGVADPDRLGIMGWSYGGFLTASTITQTPRFRAAMIGAGIVNLVSNMMGNDSPGFMSSHFGGEIWEVAELVCERTPIVHADTVTTPTLILHGEHDQRVPVWQGYEFYNALKRCGCVTQMVVYPRTGHVPGEPKLLLDVMVRTMEWMEQYVRG